MGFEVRQTSVQMLALLLANSLTSIKLLNHFKPSVFSSVNMDNEVAVRYYREAQSL